MEQPQRPAIFFDRDNTLIVSDGYLGNPDGVVLAPGAADAVARARRLGFVTVVVSNQSGVARGMFDEAAVDSVNARMDELLAAENRDAIIDRHEFCPYHPEATVEQYRQDSDRRKPKPGMILCAAEELELDLARSWLIGDAPRDIEAGKAAGCRTILVKNPSLVASPAATETSASKPDYVVSNLDDAMDVVGATLVSPSASGGQRATQVSPLQKPRVERLLEQIVDELRRRREQPGGEFSVTKLLAGVVQIIVLAVLFFAYLNRANPTSLQNILIFALVLEALTIALLIMDRQK